MFGFQCVAKNIKRMIKDFYFNHQKWWEKTNKNFQIFIFGFHCVAKNIKRTIKDFYFSHQNWWEKINKNLQTWFLAM